MFLSSNCSPGFGFKFLISSNNEFRNSLLNPYLALNFSNSEFPSISISFKIIFSLSTIFSELLNLSCNNKHSERFLAKIPGGSNFSWQKFIASSIWILE